VLSNCCGPQRFSDNPPPHPQKRPCIHKTFSVRFSTKYLYPFQYLKLVYLNNPIKCATRTLSCPPGWFIIVCSSRIEIYSWYEWSTQQGRSLQRWVLSSTPPAANSCDEFITSMTVVWTHHVVIRKSHDSILNLLPQLVAPEAWTLHRLPILEIYGINIGYL